MSRLRDLNIEFLDEEPQGLRLVTQSNLAIEFLLSSRSRLTQTLGPGENAIWNRLDVPGVYVLIGPPEPQPEHDQIHEILYIGHSDSVAERLDSHLKNPWWQTAVIFKRKTPLNLGNCKYLESRLCKLAVEIGKCVLKNKNEPQLPNLSGAEIENTEDFLRKIRVFLSAFGWDFFEPAQVLPQKKVEVKNDPPPPPAELKPVFEELKTALTAFPKATLVLTAVPDYRAKVVDGEDSRNFAGFKWTKHWFWLFVKELGKLNKYKVAKLADINETIRAAIVRAYKTAEEDLQKVKPK